MKIRTKLTLLSTFLVVLYAGGLVAVLLALTATRFLDLETALAKKDMQRVTNSLEKELDTLKTLACDWAFWDDTWRFIHGQYPEYVDSNLNPETLENLALAYLIIYDADGRRVYAASGDAETFPETSSFPADTAPQDMQKLQSMWSGIIADGEGLLISYASPVTTSDQSSVPTGLIIMARHLDHALLDTLSRQTGVPIAQWPPKADIEGIDMALLNGTDAAVVQSGNGESLQAYRLLRTPEGEPAIVIRTTTERLLAKAGVSIAQLIAALSLALAFLVWLVVWQTFRRLISKPLQDIEDALETLALSATEPQSPLESLGNAQNEMGSMVRVLKEAHARLQASHGMVESMNAELEAKVRKRTEALTSANQRLALYGRVLESTSEGVVVTDPDGVILEVNDAMCAQSGFAREDLIGQNPRRLKSGRHSNDFYRYLWAELLATGSWSGEIWDRRPSGEIYPKWLAINAIYDDDGSTTHYVGISTDITAIKTAEQRLNNLAYFDQLTGLPNRALFMDRLKRAIAGSLRDSRQTALLFIDLDRFKNVNDSLGHTVGDALLVQVAQRIASRIRTSDTACRMGGDEFTVILFDVVQAEDAGLVAGELISILSRPFEIEGMEIVVGASIGIALCPKDGTDAETLIKTADAAMFAAKETGRGTFCYASSEMDAASRKRMEIESRLRGALDRGEMALYYQPLAQAHAARAGNPAGLVGAEALIRWIPEPGVVVTPESFIDIAEESSLIIQLGAWIIQEACRQARSWMDAGLELKVSVNVSVRQFEDGRLMSIVDEALRESGLPARLLQLEVTESTFLRNLDKTVATMDSLRKLGVAFAIDDFGTGYSSLQYIKRLPVDCLKIDRAFVSGVADDLSDSTIVTAIVAMARAFGLTCTAEGVETHAQLQALKACGCNEIQGYLISRPLPAQDFWRFASRKPAHAVSVNQPEKTPSAMTWSLMGKLTEAG